MSAIQRGVIYSVMAISKHVSDSIFANLERCCLAFGGYYCCGAVDYLHDVGKRGVGACAGDGLVLRCRTSSNHKGEH